MLAVEVEGLVKRYGRVEALKGLSFKVEEGEVYGIIGPNGAGKTTTLRIVATLLVPTSGIVRVFGHDVVREAEEVRKLISYLPEDAGAYPNLTGLEYLRFAASFYAKDRRERERMVREGVKIASLGDRIADRVKTYSKGMVRRLLIARTLMVRPRLAILDEPTSGLDVRHAYYVRKTVKERAREYGTTVLLSSHNMLEVEFLCDRLLLLDRGVAVAEGRPRELLEEFGAENLEEVFVRATGLA